MKLAVVMTCVLAAVTPSSAQDDRSQFEMAVRTSDAGVSLEAVSGCDWTHLEFSSGRQPHQAVISSRGVRTVEPDFDPSAYTLDDSERFAFLVVAAADGFTAKALRGCSWTALEYRGNIAETSRARLSDIGVETARD